ncbi:MAG: hypothetical protein H5U19_09680, partial [Rhodobacteraceae bacterium]|nr:hypothetical protein [Paracoccaceae bacterium]
MAVLPVSDDSVAPKGAVIVMLLSYGVARIAPSPLSWARLGKRGDFMRKKGLFAGAVALLAAGTGAQAFEVQQYLGFADGSLEAIRAHMAGV